MTLQPEDMVLFLKSLRRARAPATVRFFQCGEYGEEGRPHHHAILFNVGFPDRVLHSTSRSGHALWRSAELERLWPYGFSTIGEVTKESAGYTARYTLKKLGSSVTAGVPPYVTMSRRFGVGHEWVARFHRDVYGFDVLVDPDGKRTRPPRFYDEWLKKKDPLLHRRLKAKRVRKAVEKVEADPREYGGSRMYQKEHNVRRRVNDFLKRGVS